MKALGLSLVAVLAMSAIVASAAQAGKLSTEGGGSTNIQADQIGGGHVFEVEGNKVTCSTAHFYSVAMTPKGSETEVEVANGATSITMHPEYKGCTAFGIINSTVTTTGCNYTIEAPGNEEAGMVYKANIKLECEAGKKVEISAAGICEATVSEQTISSGLSFVNTTVSPMDTMFNALAAPVKTVKTKDGLFCPFSGTGEVTATYTGETTAVGKKTGITLIN
jgi:hypothetical protein